MNISIVTKDELLVLDEKLNRILELLSLNSTNDSREWLKSADVKSILKCSDASLKTYRDSGRLLYSKIGGTYYYLRSNIENLLDQKL